MEDSELLDECGFFDMKNLGKITKLPPGCLCSCADDFKKYMNYMKIEFVEPTYVGLRPSNVMIRCGKCGAVNIIRLREEK